MKITGTGTVTSATSVRRRAGGERAGAAPFASELSSDTPVHASAAVADVGGIGALLAIQEVGDPTAERRRAVRRGADILDRLDELRHGLLTGSFPDEKLTSLLALVRRQQERVVDPRLREVLREIEVRAAVELAKLGRMD